MKQQPDAGRPSPRQILALADLVGELDRFVDRLFTADIPEVEGVHELSAALASMDDALRAMMLDEIRLAARALPAPPEDGFHPDFVAWWRDLYERKGRNKTQAFIEFIGLVNRGSAIPGIEDVKALRHTRSHRRDGEFSFSSPPKGYGFDRLSKLLPRAVRPAQEAAR